MARFRPYTEAGLSRVPCACCGKPSVAQWRPAVCADPQRPEYRGLCAEHDVEMNTYVLRFFFGRKREREIAAYRRKMVTRS